ncbi:hypothetical protein [Brumimicrobium mesophilum]|uniref:hypothetical protein n=1 Tax=Brumimicrobium mesophilum TaxID=392717 RepID=UPI000D141E92|nr:hypothetical protein [Brumimicrobium mesophilum]
MDWIKLYHECEQVTAVKEKALTDPSNSLITLEPQRVILAMWKETYLRRSNTLQIGLEKAFGENGVARWTADLVGRQDLSQRLATHRIPLAFYLGHGHERGWSGYRGLRIHHMQKPAEPIGLVVSLSCRSLDFGHQLVEKGYAQSFLGSDQAMKVAGLTKLVAVIANVFAENGSLLKTVEEFLIITDKYVSISTSDELKEAWSQLQLLGPKTTQI